jgi:hypothetical protein
MGAGDYQGRHRFTPGSLTDREREHAMALGREDWLYPPADIEAELDPAARDALARIREIADGPAS